MHLFVVALNVCHTSSVKYKYKMYWASFIVNGLTNRELLYIHHTWKANKQTLGKNKTSFNK